MLCLAAIGILSLSFLAALVQKSCMLYTHSKRQTCMETGRHEIIQSVGHAFISTAQGFVPTARHLAMSFLLMHRHSACIQHLC